MGLDSLRPTERFSDRAADYARFRPGYPAEAVDCVLDGLGAPAPLAAVDVGAGTGISARLLADRGLRVVALEPNAAMRAAAAPHPGVAWRDATAEATSLPGASMDLVLCAQSYHWFRPRETLAEFARILRPGGRVALVWNVRDRSDVVTDEYSRLHEQAPGSSLAGVRIDPHALDGVPRFRQLAPRVFSSNQSLDATGLVGRALSASYAPLRGPGHERLVEGLRALHSRAADERGLVRIAYRTLVFRAERV